MSQSPQNEPEKDIEKPPGDPSTTPAALEGEEEITRAASTEEFAASVAKRGVDTFEESLQELHTENSRVLEPHLNFHTGEKSGRARGAAADWKSKNANTERPEAVQITRINMIQWLCTCTGSDLKTLIVTVKANLDVTEQANHKSHVSELVAWADREGGYGLQELYRAAQVVLANFGVLMGDPIGEETLNRILDTYCAPSSYEQAVQLLETRHLLFLMGPNHYGKRATAIHLLAQRNRQAIAELAPGLTAEVLYQGVYQAASGYIADTLPVETIAGLKRGKLDQLSHRLKKIGAYLVVTIEQSGLVDADVRTDYGCLWNELPNADTTMEKHLALYLEGDKQAGMACWQNPAMQEALKNANPREIDQAAGLIAQIVKGQLTESEALARLSRNTNLEVLSWFDKNQTLELRTFMISAAVLNGCSYRAVSAAGDLLLQRIQPRDSKDVEEDPFVHTSDRINRCYLRLTPGYEIMEYGQTPIQRVELQNPNLPPIVLAHIWKEYGRLCDPLLDWLAELAEYHNLSIRVRVAAAIGELSVHDFSTLHRKVLHLWSQHPKPQLRALLTVALSIPVAEGSLTPQVLRLLHYWSTVNNFRCRWSAAAVYGGFVGQRYPEIAISDLLLIAQGGNLQLFAIACESIVQLFCRIDSLQNFAANLCDRLLNMTQQKDPLSIITGLLIFLEIAAKTRTKAIGEEDDNDWPSLLYLAQQTDVFRTQIVQLLRRALNYSDTRRIALDVLRNWLQEGDEDKRLVKILGKICSDLAKIGFDLIKTGNRHEFERIMEYLGRWAGEGNSPLQETNTAGKICQLLSDYYQLKRT